MNNLAVKLPPYQSENLRRTRLNVCLLNIHHEYHLVQNQSNMQQKTRKKQNSNIQNITGRGSIIANLHVTCERTRIVRTFSQTTIINGDKADSKILHLYLG